MSKRKDTANPFTAEPGGKSRQASSPTRRRRRWPWIILLLLIGFVFFLPNIICKTALKQKAINYALADFNGTVSVENISLGWLSPIELSGISAVDVLGNPLLEVAQVKTSLPFYAFLTGSEYGELVIEQPILYVHLRPDGSNLEDAIANMGSAGKPVNNRKPNRIPKLKVTCNNGIAHVTSSTTQEQWTIDSLNVVATTSTDNVPLSVESQCQFTSDGAPIGGFAINCQFDAGSDELSFGSAQLAINSQNVPLALAAPVMHRFFGPTSITGYMSSEMQMAYDASSNQLAANIQQLEMTGAGLAAPSLIGEDKLYAESLSVSGQIKVSPKQISATQFQLASEIATMNADGTFDATQLTNLVSAGELLDTPFHMEGEVDLARVATMLPNTLQLYDDLKIQSGIVSFQATSRQQDRFSGGNRRHMVFNIDTANIRAKRGAQNIVWQKPLRLAGTVNQADGQFVLDDVRVESDFLEMRGSGSLQAGNFSAAGDLSKLVERVSQFADLGGTELAGTLDGQFGWQIETDVAANGEPLTLLNRPIQIGGRFDIANPSIKWPDLPLWQPAQLSIQLRGAGTSLDDNRIRLDNSTVDVLIGDEKLTASLTEPIANIWDTETWSLNCHLTGGLANWMSHAKNFVDMGEIAGEGDVELTCTATIDSELLRLSQVSYAVESFGFDGYGMTIRDPKVEGQLNLDYQFADAQMLFRKLSAIGRSIAANCEQLRVTFEPNMQLHGDIAFQGDVNRIADWYGLSPQPTDIRWYGSVTGNAQFTSNQNGIGGRFSSRITDLVAAQPIAGARQSGTALQFAGQQITWKEIWREAEVNLDSTLAMSNDFETVQFQDLRVDSSSLKVTAQGNISQLSSAFLADLSGTWNPNWQMVNALLGAYTGQMVRFTGKGEQPFSVKGPIFPLEGTQESGWVHPQLKVNTSIAWDAADIFKFPLGANKVNVNLNQGIANLSANQVSLSGGTVNIAPQLDLRSENPLLFIKQGIIADRIQLTPETCRQWLKYVAPLVADATSTQGTFTINSGGVKVPLMNPIAANAQGTVRLSNVTIGAGPLAQQLLMTATQLRSLIKTNENQEARDYSTWLRMSEQEVPFAVRDQRIFHDGMTINYKDIQIRTKGSVGFDQSISMVAEIPLLDSWLEGDRWLQSLKGQSLSIPISGTLAAPRLDQRAIQQLAQQLVRQAATGALNQAVGDKIGDAQRVVNDQINDGLGKVQNQLNDTFQKQVGEKLENELFNGLNSLFKKDGDKD